MRKEIKELPAVDKSYWIIQRMSCQHFNLSLRFVGRLDKKLSSVFIYTLPLLPNDKQPKLIENFSFRRQTQIKYIYIYKKEEKMWKVQIMQQFHFDIFGQTLDERLLM